MQNEYLGLGEQSMFFQDSKVCKNWVNGVSDLSFDACSNVTDKRVRCLAAHPLLPLFVSGSKGGVLSLHNFFTSEVKATYTIEKDNSRANTGHERPTLSPFYSNTFPSPTTNQTEQW